MFWQIFFVSVTFSFTCVFLQGIFLTEIFQHREITHVASCIEYSVTMFVWEFKGKSNGKCMKKLNIIYFKCVEAVINVIITFKYMLNKICGSRMYGFEC